MGGGVCEVMTEGEMSAIDANEEIGEDEDHQERGTEEDDDEEKVWALGWSLLYFHEVLGCGSWVGRWRRWLGMAPTPARDKTPDWGAG